MGGLVAGRIESIRLGCRDTAVTQPARSEGRAAGNQAQEEFTTSTLHGSVLATAEVHCLTTHIGGSEHGAATAGSNRVVLT